VFCVPDCEKKQLCKTNQRFPKLSVDDNLESSKEMINIASHESGKEDLRKVISDLEETIKVLRELRKKL
jgi:hypothetical protein